MSTAEISAVLIFGMDVRCRQAYYRHTGYTAAYFADPVEGRTAGGMDQTLYRLEWVNVNRKAVKKICYEGEACGGILLAGIRGVKAN